MSYTKQHLNNVEHLYTTQTPMNNQNKFQKLQEQHVRIALWLAQQRMHE